MAEYATKEELEAKTLKSLADVEAPEPNAQDLLFFDGVNWSNLPAGTPGQQLIIRSDGTARYINAPVISVDAWEAKGDDATDNTAALEAAFERAEEIGADVRFGNGIYQANAGKLGIYSGGVTISGDVKGRSRLKARLGSEGFLLTIGRKNGTPLQQENHAGCNTVRNLSFDGNGRVPDVGGLNCEAQQFCTIENVFSAHFRRQAARFAHFRESVVHNLYCRTSGTAGQYPQIHIDDSAGGQECCNNLYFYGLRSVGHCWHGLAIEGVTGEGANGPLRNLYFYGAMLHGAAFELPFTVQEGYTYTASDESEFRQNGHNLLVKDARNVVFYGPRFNAAGRGFAAVRIAKGALAGSASINSVVLKNPSYGSPNSYASNISVEATAASDVLKSNQPLWLTTGAIVTVASTGTPPGGLETGKEYWAIRVSDTEIKLARTRDEAETGKAIDLTSAGSGSVSITPRWINVDHEFGGIGSLIADRGEITPPGEGGALIVNRTVSGEAAIAAAVLGLQQIYALSAAQRMLSVQVEGDAKPRWYIDSDGAQWWGTGTSTPSRLLYSPKENVLRVDAETLTVNGAINANGPSLNIAGSLRHTGAKAGFFGSAAASRPKVKPASEVTAKELCEALETLGLLE